MAKWEEGFYITAVAGSTGGSSLIVMSKGTPYTQQSYKASNLHLHISFAAASLTVAFSYIMRSCAYV